MTTTLLLIRHGESTANVDQILSGRAPGIPLTEKGREQARQVAEQLRGAPVRAVYSSPIQRAQETAAYLAERLGLPTQIAEGINETDIGEWTGWHVKQCSATPGWKELHEQPATFVFPGGESFAQIRDRAMAELRQIAARHPEALVACFSHADTIRLAAAGFLDVPLHAFMRISVDNCSLTVVTVDKEGGVRVPRINQALGTDWLPQK